MGKLTYTEEELQEARRNFKPLLIPFYYTGAVKVHKDGDGIGLVFQWWHPLTWLLLIIAFPLCAFIAEATVANSVPMRLSDYWRERTDRIQWIKVKR